MSLSVFNPSLRHLLPSHLILCRRFKRRPCCLSEFYHNGWSLSITQILIFSVANFNGLFQHSICHDTGMVQKCHCNFNLLLKAISILPTTISPLPAAAISLLPTEIFTFPKCYSQIPLASSFSAQKFCKFTDMAAFAKSKVEVTMSKIEN